jgi:outer membrane protein assembly factor BamB
MLTYKKLTLFVVAAALLLNLLAACGENSTSAPASATTNATTSAATTASLTTQPGTTPGVATTAANPTSAATSAAAPAVTTSRAYNAAGLLRISEKMTDTQLFKQNWKTSIDDTSGALVVGEQDELVYLKNRQGALYALNKTTGALVWKYAAPPLVGVSSPIEPLAIVAPSAAVVGDMSAESLAALDPKTGQAKWQYNLKFDAPSRDLGSRFIGGRVYSTTLVVAVSSKQDPLNPDKQTKNPEYILLVGIDLNTGKEVWNALTDPVERDFAARVGERLGNVIFSSQYVIVEAPDLSVGAIDGATGNRKWLTANLFLLRSQDVDRIYTGEPGGGQEHNPVVRRIDINTGRQIWEKKLPIKVFNDPLVAVSPDEKRIYLTASRQDKEVFLVAFDAEKNTILWQVLATRFGSLSMVATDDGLRFRNYGLNSGITYMGEVEPIPPVWVAGGAEFGEVVEEREGLYVTVKDRTNQTFLFLIDKATGAILNGSKVDLTSGAPKTGASQVYVPSLDASGKVVVYAFARR